MSKLKIGTVNLGNISLTNDKGAIDLTPLANAMGSGYYYTSSSTDIYIGGRQFKYKGIMNNFSEAFSNVGIALAFYDGYFSVVTYNGTYMTVNTNTGTSHGSGTYNLYARYAVNTETKESVISFYYALPNIDNGYIGDAAICKVDGTTGAFGRSTGMIYPVGEDGTGGTRRTFTSCYNVSPINSRVENNYVELVDFLVREGNTYTKAQNVKMNILSDKSETPKIIQDTNTGCEWAIVPCMGYGNTKADFALKG